MCLMLLLLLSFNSTPPLYVCVCVREGGPLCVWLAHIARAFAPPCNTSATKMAPPRPPSVPEACQLSWPARRNRCARSTHKGGAGGRLLLLSCQFLQGYPTKTSPSDGSRKLVGSAKTQQNSIASDNQRRFLAAAGTPPTATADNHRSQGPSPARNTLSTDTQASEWKRRHQDRMSKRPANEAPRAQPAAPQQGRPEVASPARPTAERPPQKREVIVIGAGLSGE